MSRNATDNPFAAKRRSALLVTDIQHDFLPGGALPVETGNEILPSIRGLMNSNRFSVYVATQDWHPPGHISFASRHKGRQPYETIPLYRREQTLWPDHCVQGTFGAELIPGLPWNVVSAIIRKGADFDTDSYSSFRNNWDARGERPRTGMAGYLRDRGIEDVFICGLARDYCVKWSAEDAVDAGFRTWVLWDASRPVIPESNSSVRQALAKKGVRLITTEEVLR